MLNISNLAPVNKEVDQATSVFAFQPLMFGILITMAESFLFNIAKLLITKLASPTFVEASRVLGLYHHLQDLIRSLSIVKVVLLDAGAEPGAAEMSEAAQTCLLLCRRYAG